MLSLDAKRSLEEAATQYAMQADAILPYLAARGISPASASTFRLGYVAEPVIGHEQYTGRLAIPYVTPLGGVVDLRFRALHDDGSPKYLSRAGAETHMYNVLAFQLDSDFIAVCEGELDAVVTHGECGIPAVGIAGAKGWKAWYARAFTDYRTVFVLCDGDQPGRDLGKQIAQQIDRAVVVSMPDGMDVTDVYLSEGAEGIRKRVGL